MSKNNSSSVSPGTVLSVVCLLLYSAGFIRIELKFNDHDQRLMAVEEVISQIKHGMVVTWNKGEVLVCGVIVKTGCCSAIHLSIYSVYYIKRAFESRTVIYF